jgi:prevent-host-death family protein
MPRLIPISELRADAASALETVKNSREPVIITQRGRAAAVMLSIAAYERAENQRLLLLQLARGDKEIAAGAGFDLDTVLAEIDDLLAGDPA